MGSGSQNTYDAIVVGASWAGIWALHLLKKQGLKVLLVDACPDVGGVWHYTRYPGCRVDTEVPLYEFAEPDLRKNWTWTERFPKRAEIQAYLRWVCERYGLIDCIKFNTRITSSTWSKPRWHLRGDNGFQATTTYFLPCSGYSTIKYIPKIPGHHENSFHSSTWDESLDYSGKSVGIVGCAASGIQIIEALAPKVKSLTVFQRTPNLATPMRQGSPPSVDGPMPNRLTRTGYHKPCNRSYFEDSEEERHEFWEGLWQAGGLGFWMGNYTDLLTSREVNDAAYNFWRNKVHERVNPKSADILAPPTPPHPFGAKRPSLETGYFEVFNQPNVTLVDLRSDPIKSLAPHGVYTKSGYHDVDILVFSTGFDFITGSMLAMGISTDEGLHLRDRWDVSANGEGVWTQLGLMTAGFPNMFFPMGPQAPSALGLTPHMAEIQGEWISDCIKYMQDHGYTTVEPTQEAEQYWKGEIQRTTRESLVGEADSWYMGVNIPGRRKEALCYFGGVDKYAMAIQESADSGYPGFTFG